MVLGGWYFISFSFLRRALIIYMSMPFLRSRGGADGLHATQIPRGAGVRVRLLHAFKVDGVDGVEARIPGEVRCHKVSLGVLRVAAAKERGTRQGEGVQ